MLPSEPFSTQARQAEADLLLVVVVAELWRQQQWSCSGHRDQLAVS